MNQTTTEHAAATTPAASRSRRLWAPIAGAAAVAAAAAVALPLTLGAQPSVMTLSAPQGDPATSMCMAVSADVVAAQELAFAGRVLEIDGDTVLLEVTERFSGDVADRVEVPQVDRMDSDFSGVPFEVGGEYLVAASDGTVASCGLSGVDDASLRAIYDEAFPN